MDKEGRNLQLLVDTNRGRTKEERDLDRLMEYGVYASLSPDGSRLVYSSCQYEVRDLSAQDPETGKRGRLGYEIAIINIDGTEPRRTTHNNTVDHYPEWSPNGDSIAYFAEATRDSLPYRLAISGGKNAPAISVAPYPPVWSPDSQYLAFMSPAEDVPVEFGYAIYVLRPDRTNLNRVGDYTTFSTTRPTWSPDGKRLGFAHSLAGASTIYTANLDGTDLREIWSSNPSEAVHPIQEVDWSPDGSELLVVSRGLWTINPNTKEIRDLGSFDSLDPFLDATWSPDGSRIAAVISEARYAYERGYSYDPDLDGPITIVTIARDGTDLRVVVAAHLPVDSYDDEPLEIYEVNPSRLRDPEDLTICSAGVVVPEPQDNPGLVRDCEVLLEIRDGLAGRASLNWSADVPILEWEGVEVEGTPARVKVLVLSKRGLTGTISPRIGELTELTRIILSSGYGSSTPNILTGPISPELGNLTNLEGSGLSGNFLSGCISEELGQLENLGGLGIGHNFLSGCIPEGLRGVESNDFEDTGLEFCSEVEVDGQ